jgi:uncharacterized protein
MLDDDRRSTWMTDTSHSSRSAKTCELQNALHARVRNFGRLDPAVLKHRVEVAHVGLHA